MGRQWSRLMRSADTEASALQAKLEALGLQNGASFGAMVSGQLPIAALPAAAALATAHAGAVTSQGDPARVSDTARTMFGIDGGGITVGHLFDSLDCLMGLASRYCEIDNKS
jgi:hypothetical protein